MTPITLRPYQTTGRERLTTLIKSGRRRILLRAPCGAGKGTIGADLVARANAKNKSTLFLVDRRVIVQDFSDRLERLGVDHGVIMANHPRRRPELRTHVASIDTLYRREVLPRADLIIIDECRGALSPKWKSVLSRYPESVILGFDATPMRPDGRGLGELFEEIVELPNEGELVDMGFLVPTRVFAPTTVNADDIKIRAGEFDEKQAAAAIDNSKIIGDIVENYRRFAAGLKAAYFCVNKKHAREAAEKFQAAGIKACAALDDTPDADRTAAWDGLDNGDLMVVVGVGLFSYGWDHPIVSCIGDLQLTASLPRHLQKMGRGARTYPGKRSMVHVDHVGNTSRHGFFDDVRLWDLAAKPKKKSAERAESVRTCKVCWACFSARLDVCPAGHPYHSEAREIDHEDGELAELKPTLRCKRCEYETTDGKAGDLCLRCGVGVMKRPYVVQKLSKNPRIAEIQREAEAKGYSSGWIWHRIQSLQQRRGVMA